MEICGKPIIAHTMECFQKYPLMDAIELVCGDGFLQQLQQIVNDNSISKVFQMIKGGAEY